MRTEAERLELHRIENRIFFEKSINHEEGRIKTWLPHTLLMQSMMRYDRDWLEDFYPELVLIHQGGLYSDTI